MSKLETALQYISRIATIAIAIELGVIINQLQESFWQIHSIRGSAEGIYQYGGAQKNAMKETAKAQTAETAEKKVYKDLDGNGHIEQWEYQEQR